MSLTAQKTTNSRATGASSHATIARERFVLMAGPTQPRPANQHLRRNPPIAGEQEAIDKAREGDGRAFEILYAMHKRRVYSLCLRMLGNVAEAEDLTLGRKGLPQVSLEETLEPSQDDGPRKDIGARDLTLSGSIDRVTLERAIENLPPGYRLVFVLHDVEGYEHNEIAEMLDCSIGNSKSQLHKARMKLRDLLRTGQRKEQIA